VTAAPAAPAVSIIVPTFNRVRTIRRALESLLAQTARDFEIVVVDDGSTDDTRAAVEDLIGRSLIRYVFQTHRNAAAARNRGIAEARGRYIAFLDSDDEWLPQKLDRQLRLLEAAPRDVGGVYCDLLRVWPDGRTTPFLAPDVVRGRIFDSRTWDYQVKGIGTSATLLRRECLPAEGFDEKLYALCDLDLLLRISQAWDLQHQRELLVRYHAGEGISTNLEGIAAARAYLLAKHGGHFRGQARYLAYQYSKMATARLLGGRSEAARRDALRALRADPLSPRIALRAIPAVLGLRSGPRLYLWARRWIRPGSPRGWVP
jgi:glycosyltransferase involved in cell wall biosynthesis